MIVLRGWLALLLVAGCHGEPDPPSEPRREAPVEAPVEAPPPPEDREAVRLGVPPELLHRAREEAAGLERLPASLRQQAIERGRERGSPPYDGLRREIAAHENARVSYEGHVGLVRPAGTGLWILALQTRRDGERWLDPLYVLSVVPPGLPRDGGATARIDGWVVGERTIGRNALPLIVAFHVERSPEPAEPSAGSPPE